MTASVIDTNVAIAANGRNTHADEACQLACVDALEIAIGREIAIDDRGLIICQYAKHLSFAGRPGVGDKFFKHVFDNQYRPARVRRVTISPTDDDQCGFNELPPNKLDRSDRKFLAVAVVANAVILNATDSDWHEQATLMEDLKVEVRQLCPQHSTKQSKHQRPR